MSVQKATRRKRDWYSVSEETLRAIFVLLGTVIVLGAGFFGYRFWESHSLEREAGQVIE